MEKPFAIGHVEGFLLDGPNGFKSPLTLVGPKSSIVGTKLRKMIDGTDDGLGTSEDNNLNIYLE